MKNGPPLERSLCERYCAYYKPGKNEELACRGHAVVERLQRRKAFVLPEARRGKVDLNGVDLLIDRLCKPCDFFKSDCDFMSDRTASPCGGFLLLAQLIECGAVSIDDISA